MTNEEAKANLEFERNLMCKNCDPLGFGCSVECDFCRSRRAFDMALSALEKQNKYRWHDLRKDPNDLPENTFNKHFIVFDGTGYSFPTGAFICDYIFAQAWREIEPFEEVSE